MKYALLVYSDQSGWSDLSEDEAARRREESMPAWIALFEELGKADPDANGFELESGMLKTVLPRALDRSNAGPGATNFGSALYFAICAFA